MLYVIRLNQGFNLKREIGGYIIKIIIWGSVETTNIWFSQFRSDKINQRSQY